MKILYDINIILDVLLSRYPFFLNSARVMAMAENREIDGWLCGDAATTIHYLIRKKLGNEKATKNITRLLNIFKITEINKSVISAATVSPIKDFEDAVVEESAKYNSVDIILTRDLKDFQNSTLKIYSPEDFINLYPFFDKS